VSESGTFMSRGWDPWTERPLPEVVRVAYPHPPEGVHVDYPRDHLATATAMYRDMGMTYWLEKAETGA